MESNNWRSTLQPDSRKRTVNNIIETLNRHTPSDVQAAVEKLKEIAVQFEEKIYTEATSQSQYEWKISLKMRMIESRYQNVMPQLKPFGNNNRPPDPRAAQSMQPQVQNQGQNLFGDPQKSAENSSRQEGPTNMFANSQRQMSVRQQVVPQQQQHQFQFRIQQLQQQQNLIQPTQVQSSKQSSMQTSSVMQPSLMQLEPLCGLQQNQLSSVQQSAQSMLQQHPHSVLKQQQPQQAASIYQQQAPMVQQSLLPPQQQQKLVSPHQNATDMLHNQLIRQQNNVEDMQQKQHRLLGQQCNMKNLQQQQQPLHQLMARQNNISSMHQLQLGSQSNVSGFQQQHQLLGTQPGNSVMQTNQQSVHMRQQPKVPLQQQTRESASNLLPSQGQQPQPQLSQKQLMSQIQPQIKQLQQQLELQQPLKRDLQAGPKASSQVPASLIQRQNVMDQQKQLYQLQRPFPETPSTSHDSTTRTGCANGGDWQEEVYQKIKAMKEMYLPELNEIYHKIATKLQQHKTQQIDDLRLSKARVERIISFLQISKKSVLPGFKEKLGSYEKLITYFINTNRPRKQVTSMQQGQLPQPQVQQPQSQEFKSHENQMNSHMQPVNMKGSVLTVQQNNMSSLQKISVSSFDGVSTPRQNMMSSLEPSHSDSGEGNVTGTLQQGGLRSQQQNPVNVPQQANITNLSSESRVNMLQSTIPLQSNSNTLQHQLVKQLHKQQLPKQQFQPHMQQEATVAQPPAPCLAIGTPGVSASPLLADLTGSDCGFGNSLTIASCKSTVKEQPLKRLIEVVKSLSPKALSASVSDIVSVISMTDRISDSAPGNGSSAAVGEDLVTKTNFNFQARNFITQDGMSGRRKMRRYTNAMPWNVVSSASSTSDSFKHITQETSDLESSVTSSVKKPRIEADHALLKEIHEINQRLIDTVVDISKEDVDPTAAGAAAEGGEGTIVKCSFGGVALSPNLKSQYASAEMLPIQPLILRVPTDYPNCSPMPLHKLPDEFGKESKDLSLKAKSRFNISLRRLSQPMSLEEMAGTWDVCARAVISEHAQQSGGGSFSSKFGTWENCLSAA